MRLRWAAIVAQVVTILGVAYLLQAPFPLAPLVATVSFLALANLLLWQWLRSGRGLSDTAATAHLLLDIAALTWVLVWTGGAMNPFTTLYLLHVALAAVLVPRRFSLVVAACAAVAFGGLLVARPEAIHIWHSGRMFLLHVRGMWIAFTLTAACLWFFIDRVSTSLREREGELTAARLEMLRTERLVALVTLAAGTAHELNTPLGTVAILAAELSELLAAGTVERDHADMIRGEIRRCSAILTTMRSHEEPTSPFETVALGPWIASRVAEWRERHPDTVVTVAASVATVTCRANVRPVQFTQALSNVLDNARRATRDAGRTDAIEIAVHQRGATVAVAVVDHGVGIAAGDLPRLGEPFFTTREAGHGMGLGLFLVRATLAQHHGSLDVRSDPTGTTVTLTVPVASGDGLPR